MFKIFNRNDLINVIVTVIITFISFSLYEILKDELFPFISKTTSHIITICFATILSILITLLILYKKKKIKQVLIESENKYHSLFENMLDVVTIVNNDKQIIDVNPAAQELFEYTREELLNMSLDQMIYKDDKHISDEHFQKLEQTGSYAMYEGRIITKTGKIKWIQVNSTQILKQGNKIGSQDVCRNITQRKNIEIELEQSIKQLNHLNADKDRFISILGHDLKNPFSNILGFSEILTKEIDSLNSDEIKEIAANINKSAKNTNNLLEDILLWARTQQGNIPFKPLMLSFAEKCKDVVDVLKPNADAKNITINYSERSHLNVFADIDMIKTVMRNLVSNAIKYTNNGGVINISAKENSDIITISVSDNGIGIAHDELKKLFDISEVLTTKGTAGEAGTGLGLLLCKEFVEKHNGKIWVESKVGKGSDFKFILPIFTKKGNLMPI